MRALLQRVSQASVVVNGNTIGQIASGLLVFLAVQPDDSEECADRLLDKILGYRIFSDSDGKMNRDVREVHGGVLVVSQFTLAADTRKGLRPSFTTAAPPQQARALYDYFVTQLQARYPPVATGEFAADMQVQLINDGPVTILLES